MVAKKRIDTAVQLLATRDVQIALQYNWIPFMLNPELPESGWSLSQYYENQYGSGRNPALELPNLQKLDPAIHWKVYEPSDEPNVGTTLHAHRLVHWSGQFGPHAQESVVD